MKNIIKSLILSALLFTNIAHARKEPSDPKKIDEYFELLSYEKTDFEPMGAVCERVAVREVEVVYPAANYNIMNSISYTEHKTTIGELDVVIFDKETKKVEAVAEVKCWRSFGGALKKARDQRQRFLTHLNNNIEITDQDGKRYSKDLFKNIQKYFSISQSGGVNQGFDVELSLSLNDLMLLRSKLLDCKASGRCPRR